MIANLSTESVRAHALGSTRSLRVRSAALVVAGIAIVAALESPAQEAWRVENWVNLQRNENGSAQWKYEPRLYVPFALGSGWTFTQRLDVPLIYTDARGSANPGAEWSYGLGNVLIEEIFDSPEVAPGLRLRGSVRLVFPTGKASPFGSSQYQWAPGFGAIYARPNDLGGVTLEPYVRYFSGFAPTEPDVKEVRQWDIYPAATFTLSGPWALQFYPDNPIRYDRQNNTWFVPLDVMLSYRIDRRWQLGLGGAYALGNPRDPPYRYIVDAKLSIAY